MENVESGRPPSRGNNKRKKQQGTWSIYLYTKCESGSLFSYVNAIVPIVLFQRNRWRRLFEYLRVFPHHNIGHNDYSNVSYKYMDVFQGDAIRLSQQESMTTNNVLLWSLGGPRVRTCRHIPSGPLGQRWCAWPRNFLHHTLYRYIPRGWCIYQ